MRDIISSKEVNIGRQEEFDYLKGIFMIFIFLIHSFQATMSDESSFVSGIYMFATMSGAAIFIFVMGFGSTYSKRADAGDLAKNGVRMVIYQYLNNLLYIASLALPYPFVASSLSEAGLDNFSLSMWAYFQYTNIFFITGILYLVLAALKKLGLPTIGYLCLGVLAGFIAPFLYGVPVDVPVLGYIVTLLIGDAMFVSFTPLYFLSYALIGVAAGRLYRRLNDKKAFYRKMLPVCSATAAASRPLARCGKPCSYFRVRGGHIFYLQQRQRAPCRAGPQKQDRRPDTILQQAYIKVLCATYSNLFCCFWLSRLSWVFKLAMLAFDAPFDGRY